MESKLTKEELNNALCDVRKAHRLIYAYQRRMLDLTHFIKSKLVFSEYDGNKLFCNTIRGRNNSYGKLSIGKDMWAWDFLYSYVFEYYFGKKDGGNYETTMSVIQVSDTGCFDSNVLHDSRIDITTFSSEENAITKLIFVIEKRDKQNEYAWADSNWLGHEVYNNNERMSAKHTVDTLNQKGNVQIIYSFPLERFLNEEATIETLKEFVEYCNNNGITELKLEL